MSKVAFLFSGQGAQYVGMGKALAASYPEANQVFLEADGFLGFPISQLCFEGSKEALDQTENTQPAILTTSIAALRVLTEKGVKPQAVAGLSLGEYTALVCSGVFKFEDAVKLVRKRGQYMQEAVPLGVGTMAAIFGLDAEAIKKICSEAGRKGIVEPANFNCPGQIVIGGEKEAVQAATEIAKEQGAKVIPLAVSAPFHTSMLKSASTRLEAALNPISLGDIQIPVLSNVSGDYITASSEIKDLLTAQVMNPVLWENIIFKMLEDGIDHFIEIGPGKALSGFVKRINKQVKISNVEDPQSLEKTLQLLVEEGVIVC